MITPPPHPVADPSARSRAPRTWATATSVGVLSALLASGSTYVVVNATGVDQPVVSEATSGTASSSRTGTTSQSSKAVNASDPAKGWGNVASAVAPSVVSITVRTGQGEGAGSGVVWDDAGHIVTNAHVVDGAGKVQVTLADARTYAASVVGADPATDLAVVELDAPPDNLVPIDVGDDKSLAVGDPVMAVGNPLGLSGTVTTGIVSALNRPVTTQSENIDPITGQPNTVVTNAIQTSAAINPGNSGGPLLDSAGHLVGINSSIASLSTGMGQPGSIGIGFAIPVGEVQTVATQLLKTGTVEHAYLGIGLRDTQAKDGPATIQAAGVTSVQPGSPAKQVGLLVGDAITTVDGVPVAGSLGLVAQVRARTAGDQVVLGFVRDGQQREVTATLVATPASG